MILGLRKGQWVTWAGPELPGAYKTPGGRYVGIVVAPGTDSLGGVQADWCVRPVNDQGADVLYLAPDGSVKRLEVNPEGLEALRELTDRDDIPEPRRRHLSPNFLPKE